jgi:hypothetical protein
MTFVRKTHAFNVDEIDARLKGPRNFYRFVGSGKCWRDHLYAPQRVEKPGPLMSRETEDTCPRPKVSFNNNNNSKKFPKS